MTDYRERFQEWFTTEEQDWHGLTGHVDASKTMFFSTVPDSRWHKENLLGNIVSKWEANEDLADWQQWLLRGIQSGKVELKWKSYDLTQMVDRPNRWKHKESTGTKKLTPGDVVCPKGTNRKYLFGFDVSSVLHCSEQIYKTKPTIMLPNIPIPAVALSPDGSSALFVFPIVGKEDDMPHLYALQHEASFGDFFTA